MCIGDKLQIQCYKHNGSIYKAYDEAILLDDKKDYMVFGNNKTMVFKAIGSAWRTKEPAIMYFFKDKWFNIIAQMKKDGIYYYCNIASPFIIEENTIKFIDYDLDLRVFPNGQYKVLDRLEHNYYKRIMNYSDDLEKVILNSLDQLIKEYQDGLPMFTDEMNNKYYQVFKALKEE